MFRRELVEGTRAMLGVRLDWPDREPAANAPLQMLASYVPTLRATAVNPVTALRAE